MIQSPATRRSVLLASLSALISGTTLNGCGGSDDDAPAPAPTPVPTPPSPPPGQQAAEAAAEAVRQGLVGVVFGQIDARQPAQIRSDIAGAGLRKLGSMARISGEESFIIGSNTKAMTAVVVARLIAQGTLRWDTGIGEAIPALQDRMRPEYRSVTMEQLLAHRGGLLALTDPAELQQLVGYIDDYAGELPQTLVARRRFVAEWALNQTPPTKPVPGRDFLYSNAGYILVGAMLEAITGQAFEALFEQHLSQPLGVAGGWKRPEFNATNPTFGHTGQPGKIELQPAFQAEEQDWLDVIGPSGLFSTTPAAYANWLHWHLLALQGQSTPLPAGYIQRLKALTEGDYGVGWLMVPLDGRSTLAHTGHWAGYMAEAAVDLAGLRAGFGLTNIGDESEGGDSWVLRLLNNALIQMDLRAR